jgi:hypothetical protein
VVRLIRHDIQVGVLAGHGVGWLVSTVIRLISDVVRLASSLVVAVSRWPPPLEKFGFAVLRVPAVRGRPR